MATQKKILLVDDTETVLMFEKMMLMGRGYQLVVARDGQEALEKVASEQPDLVILDIIMPKRNGIEVCRLLKENPASKHIPVMMVTTKGEPDKVMQAYQAGCDEYMTKPLSKVDLLAKVSTLLA